MKRLSSVGRRKVQDDVDKNVVIQDVQQEALPSIQKQSSKDSNNNDNNVDVDKKKVEDDDRENHKEEISENNGNSEESEKSEESSRITFLNRSKTKTPDLVPKSFQDKR